MSVLQSVRSRWNERPVIAIATIALLAGTAAAEPRSGRIRYSEKARDRVNLACVRDPNCGFNEYDDDEVRRIGKLTLRGALALRPGDVVPLATASDEGEVDYELSVLDFTRQGRLVGGVLKRRRFQVIERDEETDRPIAKLLVTWTARRASFVYTAAVPRVVADRSSYFTGDSTFCAYLRLGRAVARLELPVRSAAQTSTRRFRVPGTQQVREVELRRFDASGIVRSPVPDSAPPVIERITPIAATRFAGAPGVPAGTFRVRVTAGAGDGVFLAWSSSTASSAVDTVFRPTSPYVEFSACRGPLAEIVEADVAVPFARGAPTIVSVAALDLALNQGELVLVFGAPPPYPTGRILTAPLGVVDAAPVNLSVEGEDFLPGATLQVVRNGTAVVTAPADVAADGTSLEAALDLAGVTPGFNGLDVVNPDGTRGRVPYGLGVIGTVRAPATAVDLVSPRIETFALSPDGRFVAWSERDPGGTTWTVRAALFEADGSLSSAPVDVSDADASVVRADIAIASDPAGSHCAVVWVEAPATAAGAPLVGAVRCHILDRSTLASAAPVATVEASGHSQPALRPFGATSFDIASVDRSSGTPTSIGIRRVSLGGVSIGTGFSGQFPDSLVDCPAWANSGSTLICASKHALLLNTVEVAGWVVFEFPVSEAPAGAAVYNDFANDFVGGLGADAPIEHLHVVPVVRNGTASFDRLVTFTYRRPDSRRAIYAAMRDAPDPLIALSDTTEGEEFGAVPTYDVELGIWIVVWTRIGSDGVVRTVQRHFRWEEHGGPVTLGPVEALSPSASADGADATVGIPPNQRFYPTHDSPDRLVGWMTGLGDPGPTPSSGTGAGKLGRVIVTTRVR